MDHFLDVYIPTLRLFWPTLLAAATLAIAGASAGVLVILRRQTLLALSLPQIVTLGAAIGLRMGWPTLPPAVGCLALVLLLIAWSARRRSTHVLLPAIYVAGASVAILVVAGAAAELIDVQNMFVGIDVAVAPAQAAGAASALVGAAIVIAIFWRRWLVIAQAPTTAELAGLHPPRWDAVFLILLSIILLLGTDTLGAALAIIVLFLPAATVLPWSRRIPDAIAMSSIAALLFVICGFAISIEMNWPFSHSVGGVGSAVFLVSHLLNYHKSH